jgi:hypothetical protein
VLEQEKKRKIFIMNKKWSLLGILPLVVKRALVCGHMTKSNKINYTTKVIDKTADKIKACLG